MAAFLLIVCALSMSVSLVMAFRSSALSVVAAYVGMWAASTSRYAYLPSDVLLFWAVAVWVVVGIDIARRDGRVYFPSAGRVYIAGGSLIGMLVGLVMGGAAALTLGAAIGTVLGAMAFTRFGSGVSYRHSLWKAVVVIGLPVTVAMVELGTTLSSLIAVSSR